MTWRITASTAGDPGTITFETDDQAYAFAAWAESQGNTAGDVNIRRFRFDNGGTAFEIDDGAGATDEWLEGLTVTGSTVTGTKFRVPAGTIVAGGALVMDYETVDGADPTMTSGLITTNVTRNGVAYCGFFSTTEWVLAADAPSGAVASFNLTFQTAAQARGFALFTNQGTEANTIGQYRLGAIPQLTVAAGPPTAAELIATANGNVVTLTAMGGNPVAVRDVNLTANVTAGTAITAFATNANPSFMDETVGTRNGVDFGASVETVTESGWFMSTGTSRSLFAVTGTTGAFHGVQYNFANAGTARAIFEFLNQTPGTNATITYEYDFVNPREVHTENFNFDSSLTLTGNSIRAESVLGPQGGPNTGSGFATDYRVHAITVDGVTFNATSNFGNPGIRNGINFGQVPQVTGFTNTGLTPFITSGTTIINGTYREINAPNAVTANAFEAWLRAVIADWRTRTEAIAADQHITVAHRWQQTGNGASGQQANWTSNVATEWEDLPYFYTRTGNTFGITPFADPRGGPGNGILTTTNVDAESYEMQRFDVSRVTTGGSGEAPLSSHTFPNVNGVNYLSFVTTLNEAVLAGGNTIIRLTFSEDPGDLGNSPADFTLSAGTITEVRGTGTTRLLTLDAAATTDVDVTWIGDPVTAALAARNQWVLAEPLATGDVAAIDVTLESAEQAEGLRRWLVADPEQSELWFVSASTSTHAIHHNGGSAAGNFFGVVRSGATLTLTPNGAGTLGLDNAVDAGEAVTGTRGQPSLNLINSGTRDGVPFGGSVDISDIFSAEFRAGNQAIEVEFDVAPDSLEADDFTISAGTVESVTLSGTRAILRLEDPATTDVTVSYLGGVELTVTVDTATGWRVTSLPINNTANTADFVFETEAMARSFAVYIGPGDDAGTRINWVSDTTGRNLFRPTVPTLASEFFVFDSITGNTVRVTTNTDFEVQSGVTFPSTIRDFSNLANGDPIQNSDGGTTHGTTFTPTTVRNGVTFGDESAVVADIFSAALTDLNTILTISFDLDPGDDEGNDLDNYTVPAGVTLSFDDDEQTGVTRIFRVDYGTSGITDDWEIQYLGGASVETTGFANTTSWIIEEFTSASEWRMENIDQARGFVTWFGDSGQWASDGGSTRFHTYINSDGFLHGNSGVGSSVRPVLGEGGLVSWVYTNGGAAANIWVNATGRTRTGAAATFPVTITGMGFPGSLSSLGSVQSGERNNVDFGAALARVTSAVISDNDTITVTFATDDGQDARRALAATYTVAQSFAPVTVNSVTGTDNTYALSVGGLVGDVDVTANASTVRSTGWDASNSWIVTAIGDDGNNAWIEFETAAMRTQFLAFIGTPYSRTDNPTGTGSTFYDKYHLYFSDRRRTISAQSRNAYTTTIVADTGNDRRATFTISDQAISWRGQTLTNSVTLLGMVYGHYSPSSVFQSTSDVFYSGLLGTGTTSDGRLGIDSTSYASTRNTSVYASTQNSVNWGTLNMSPVVATPGIGIVDSGETQATFDARMLAVSATDTDGTITGWSISADAMGSPNLSISNAGVITLDDTHTPIVLTDTTYNYTVTATDDGGATDDEPFFLTVQEAGDGYNFDPNDNTNVVFYGDDSCQLVEDIAEWANALPDGTCVRWGSAVFATPVTFTTTTPCMISWDALKSPPTDSSSAHLQHPSSTHVVVDDGAGGFDPADDVNSMNYFYVLAAGEVSVGVKLDANSGRVIFYGFVPVGELPVAPALSRDYNPDEDSDDFGDDFADADDLDFCPDGNWYDEEYSIPTNTYLRPVIGTHGSIVHEFDFIINPTSTEGNVDLRGNTRTTDGPAVRRNTIAVDYSGPNTLEGGGFQVGVDGGSFDDPLDSGDFNPDRDSVDGDPISFTTSATVTIGSNDLDRDNAWEVDGVFNRLPALTMPTVAQYAQRLVDVFDTIGPRGYDDSQTIGSRNVEQGTTIGTFALEASPDATEATGFGTFATPGNEDFNAYAFAWHEDQDADFRYFETSARVTYTPDTELNALDINEAYEMSAEMYTPSYAALRYSDPTAAGVAGEAFYSVVMAPGLTGQALTDGVQDAFDTILNGDPARDKDVDPDMVTVTPVDASSFTLRPAVYGPDLAFTVEALSNNADDEERFEAILQDAQVEKRGVITGERMVDTQTDFNVDDDLEGDNRLSAVFTWPRGEVNFNLEYPLFAQGRATQGQVAASDVTYSLTDGSAYESYIERKQLAITPEFDTEMVTSMALWADGFARNFTDEPPYYNRLEVRAMGTNNPGQPTDLHSVGGNVLPISEGYKTDLRVHGRFINLRVSDQVNDEVQDPASADYTGDELENNYRQTTAWRLSGMQADVKKQGTR